MATIGSISVVKLPNGNEYEIKDKVARETMSGAIKLVGTTTTALDDMDTTNPIQIAQSGGTTKSYTAVANDAVFYGNKEFVFDGVNWHEFGDMSGVKAMGKVDQGTVTITPAGQNASSTVTFTSHTKDAVLGEATTFTNGSSTVTFGEHTTVEVLKSSVTATVPKPSATTKYLTASASGTTAGVGTSATAITDLGEETTDTFVKSYPGTTSKLATTSITGVSGSTTASKATAGTAVAVAKTGTAVSVANGLNAETTTHSADTLMYNATVDAESETLSFSFKSLSKTNVTPAVSNGTITPYTFTDVTVPKAASAATTVATGSLSATGSGGTVMTGLGTATTASAITALGTPTTDTFAKTVTITAQPTITLTAGSSTSTGAAKYVEAIGTSGTNSVTFSKTGNVANAITALGTGIAGAQIITVGTNDKVNAITALGTGTAGAQKFTGTTQTYDVNPKTSS